jgi:hypothetical protein
MKTMVDRFLNWPLPASVCSDQCATMPGYPDRIGTNLLTATEAEQMLEHVAGPVLAENKRLREALGVFMEAAASGSVNHMKLACSNADDVLTKLGVL